MSFYDWKGGTPEEWQWFKCDRCGLTFKDDHLAEDAPESWGELCQTCHTIEVMERGTEAAEMMMEDR